MQLFLIKIDGSPFYAKRQAANESQLAFWTYNLSVYKERYIFLTTALYGSTFKNVTKKALKLLI